MSLNTIRIDGRNLLPTAVEGTISWSFGNDTIRPLTPPMVGMAELTIYSIDGEWNGIFRVGRELILRESISAVMWQGVIERVTRDIGGPTLVLVRVTGVQDITRLTGLNIERKVGGPQLNIRIDQAIERILDAADITLARDIEPAQTTLKMWPTGAVTDAWAEITRLVKTEGPGANFWQAGDFIRFRSRHGVLLRTESTNIQRAYGPGGNAPVINRPIVREGQDTVYNIVETKVVERRAERYGIVWQLENTPFEMKPNETADIVAEFDAPVTLNFAMGSPLEINVTDGDASLSIESAGPVSARLSVTAGASGATIESLKVVGVKHPVVNEIVVESTYDTSVSQNVYGERRLSLDIDEDVDVYYARDLCNAIARWYEDGRRSVEFDMADTAYLDAVTNGGPQTDLQQRVRVIVPQLASDEQYWITKVKQTIESDGFQWARINAIEPIGESFSQWNQTTWGTGVWGF